MGKAIKKYGWKRNDLVTDLSFSWIPRYIVTVLPYTDMPIHLNRSSQPRLDC